MADGPSSIKGGILKVPTRRFSLLRQKNKEDNQLEEPRVPHFVTGQSAYLGSYARSLPQGSVDANVSRRTPPAPSPRASTSHLQLEHLLKAVDADLETYGVEELRDGFFDASFHRPLQQNHDHLMDRASLTLPESFRKNHPLSHRDFLPQQLHKSKAFFRRVTTSRAGIKLAKSFLGFFIAYIICLIPASRDWLGRYSYMMVISTVINHPGRAVGSQIDGAFLTVLGAIAGLGWGSLALYLSTSTPTARGGYGGILATFLIIFAALIGWLRCVFIRFYQGVLAAGIAIFYTCLADTSQTVGWKKVFDYGIPWVLGQAICLLVAIIAVPDAGSRLLSLALRDALRVIQDGLALPRDDSPTLRRRLAWQFVNVSQAVRDFTIEMTFSRFDPEDLRASRNLIQGVIRSILAIRPDTTLFDDPNAFTVDRIEVSTPDVSGRRDAKAMYLICSSLQAPTRMLIDAMTQCMRQAEHAVMTIGGQSSGDIPGDLSESLEILRIAKQVFDSADAELIAHPDLPSRYAKSPDVVELFLFVHPVRQSVEKVESLVVKLLQMQENSQRWRIRAPSYPFKKAFMRTNPQVRHDRGGLTAGFYFRSQRQLDRTMADLRSTAYIPAARHEHAGDDPNQLPVLGEYQQEQEMAFGMKPNVSSTTRFRYQLWEALHRLQGFESRFAFKVTLVTTLVSIPAWLNQSRGWWNDSESWWAVVTVWVMMHPRVGGTFQDLVVRVFCASIGAIWGGLAYAAGAGNPYVMATLAAIYMVPMLYRFTQSSHPRSGVMGCISFIVVSLSAYNSGGQPSIVTVAWTRGLAFIVGIIAAVIVNWVLWPFIARHELRKSLSAMTLHSAILYRGVVAKYVYYSKGEEPGPDDIARSEMLEGRLREGFVRMRQLMELTRHEMRLRAPFDPLPYSALITACESFFEHLVQVRQSALYFQPSMLRTGLASSTSLTAPRRDAVAVILMNLYVLACALRANRPVPKYLPSAAGARRLLLDRMEVIEAEQAAKREADGVDMGHEEKQGRRWADVYQYAFNGALTEIVEQLQELQRYTKEVCGEVEWDGDE